MLTAVARVMMKNEKTKTRSKKTSNRSTRAPGATAMAGPSRSVHRLRLTDRVSQQVALVTVVAGTATGTGGEQDR
jgi:hypothetical protein